MRWRQLQCHLMGHYWKTYVDHSEWGTPRLVRCRRCGYVSSLEDERLKRTGRWFA